MTCARAVPPLPVLPGPPDFAVVSWNLHGDAGDVPALVRDLKAGRLTGDTPPAAFALLLQEASPRTRIDGLHWFFAAARTVDGTERGSALLSSLPLADTRVIALPRERQPRIATIARVTVQNEDLLLVNAHLENRAPWWKGGLPGDSARARQMEALLAQLPPGPGVLGGDLNVWLGTEESAYKAAAGAFPDGLDTEPPLTFGERLALDHLLFRLPARWRAIRYRAAHRYGSDHFPVVGVLVSR
jgi:endonuclease/exonuclease/phosphatase family metal-dependent hydrolase